MRFKRVVRPSNKIADHVAIEDEGVRRDRDEKGVWLMVIPLFSIADMNVRLFYHMHAITKLNRRDSQEVLKFATGFVSPAPV